MDVGNCTLCQAPLVSQPDTNLGFFSRAQTAILGLFSRVQILGCGHQLHQACFIQCADHIYREKPEETEFTCHLRCELRTKITTFPSAKRIILCEQEVKNLCSHLVASLCGVIAAMKLSHLSILKRICFVMGIWFAGGLLTIIALEEIYSSKIQKKITDIYNKIYGTEIPVSDVALYKSGIFDLPAEYQLCRVLAHFCDLSITDIQERLTALLTLYSEEDQQHVRAHINSLEDMKGLLKDNPIEVGNYIKEYHGDNYAACLRLGAHLLESIGNTEQKDDLKSILKPIILANVNTDYLITAPDKTVGIRLAAIKALEIEKNRLSWINPHYALWFTHLQEEYNSSDPELISQLLASPLLTEYDFKTISISSLLLDDDLAKKMLDAIYAAIEEA